MASPFLTSNKPTISKSPGAVKTSGITLMPNLPAGTYTLITNPVKTKDGTFIDAADTMTISYSASMKKAAQDLAKTGNPIEKAAANYYLFMDDPTKKGSAKYYENLLKKAGIDINAKSDTGNPIGDFALDVVKGFVGSPAQTARTIAGGGLGAVLLSKEKDKAETLKGGGKNLIDSTIQAATESPGQLVGGALAGVAGAKGLGILTKKPTIPQTIKTSDFKQTAVKSGSQTLDADFTIKGASYKYKNKSTGGKRRTTRDGRDIRADLMEKALNRTPEAKIARQLEKRYKIDRGKGVAAKVELGDIDPFINAVKIDLVNNPFRYNHGLRVKTVKSGDVIGLGKTTGRTKLIYDEFDLVKKPQTSLVTAEEARRPKNNTKFEQRRVRRIVEAQKQSGAIFQGMKVKLKLLPQRIPEWGLVTAEEARKPKNKSVQERRRVQEVKKAQQKVGAAKPSPEMYLDFELRLNQQIRGVRKQRSGKKPNLSTLGREKPGKTVNTRRPRAYEATVWRRSTLDGYLPETPALPKNAGVFQLKDGVSLNKNGGITMYERVPRYAAGANRPITIQGNERMIFTRDGVITEPQYTLKLEPVSGWKEAKTKRSIERVRTKSDQKPEKKGGAGAKTKAKAENPQKKKTAVVEFEELDIGQIKAGRTSSSKRSIGTKRDEPKSRQPRTREVKRKNRVENASEIYIPDKLPRDGLVNLFENIDVDSFVQAGKTTTSKKSSGTSSQKRKPANTQRKDAETVIEVDNGNGTKSLVRVKAKTESKTTTGKGDTQERRVSQSSAKLSEPVTLKRGGRRVGGAVRRPKPRQNAEEIRRRQQQANATKRESGTNKGADNGSGPKAFDRTKAGKTPPSTKTGKQTKVTGDKSTITVKAKTISQNTKAQRIVKPTSEQRFNTEPNLLSLSQAKTGTTIKQDNPVIPDTVIINRPTSQPVTPGVVDGEGKTKTRTLTIPKTTPKGKTQEIKRTKAGKATPKTKTKKTARLRLKEEEKKKKKRIVKTKKENALRLETVNQFGWLGLDKKPAAKPRKIK